MPKIETEWQRFETLTTGELYELLRFRQAIFVVEQHSAYPDLDGLDQNAWHLVARFENEQAGYLRLIPVGSPPALVRIGRIAVSPHRRRRGIGHTLMQEAVNFCRDRYPLQPLGLGAQVHLVSFYESFGFAVTSEPYDDFGVAHVDMVLRL